MAAPNYSVSQFPNRNPHAKSPLLLTMIAVPNTSPEQIVANLRANTALPLNWLVLAKTEKPAVMVGGGPSAADHLEDIKQLQADGGVVFAMNGASRWLRENRIIPDWQVIADAKEETASLVDPQALGHLFSSVVNPKTMNSVPNPIVWHPLIIGIEQCFPEDRKTQEYSLIGGTTAGTHGMCVAYVMGHREFHCFGFDSSHRGAASHAYAQPMNDNIPNVEVDWAGKKYLASIAMKAQAEQFQLTGRAMQKLGCVLHIHGDGLLPAMWNTAAENLSERDKYRLLWSTENYRVHSPAEEAVPSILDRLKPDSLVLDFGCGTGRASLELAKLGIPVLLIDFADNCRDAEAITLPFLEWDLTKPLELRARFGICFDVMEHIPTDDVSAVIDNVMGAAENVFFQISTVADSRGALIGATLHNTVKPHEWWHETFEQLGYCVQWQERGRTDSRFVIIRKQAA